ncbi:MAG: hypothetical protein AAF550_04065 [Myxococcota bacterium]
MFLIVFIYMKGPLLAEAQEAPEDETSTRPSVQQTADPVRMATQIEQLIAGELDPMIDPAQLFSAAVEDLPELFATSAPETRTRETRPGRHLVDARRAFLALPADERQRVLQEHEIRHDRARADERQQRSLRQALAATLAQSRQLAAFLEGTLSAEVDPSAFLVVDLLNEREVALNQKRRSTFTSPEQESEEPTAEGRSQPLQLQLRTAYRQLDRLRGRYAALSVDARTELHRRHADALQIASPNTTIVRAEAERAAERAASEREQALEDSRNARSEALRVLAEERALLLGVRENQAQFSLELAQQHELMDVSREEALGWVRRVRDLAKRSLLEDGRQQDADRLYGRLVSALNDSRSALGRKLESISSRERAAPGPAAAPNVPGHIDARDVDILYDELRTSEARLSVESETIQWEHAEVLRDSVVQMNKARLRLLENLTPSKRASLRGFGAEGIRQASREMEQIGLEIRFHILELPRFFQTKLEELRSSPLPVLLSLLQFVFLVVLFRAWRRRADGVLDEAYKHYDQKRLHSVAKRVPAVLFWYLKQLRRPVEWLAFAAVLVGIVADIGDLPEIEYVWIVVLWTLVGSLVVRLVNAVAGRQSLKDASATLRIRSLRVVGVTVVLLGLVLSLTESSVGQGAIYNWVLSTCWVLAVPIALLLVYWWRPTVLARARSKHNPSPVIRWVASKDRGLVSFSAAAIGGVSLLFDGLKRYALRQAANFTVMQGLLAYLFRREVEKQAEIRGAGASYETLDDAPYSALGTDVASSHLVERIMANEVNVVRELIKGGSCATIAVVGERGLGKTTFFDRATAHVSANEVIRISCQPGGFEVVLGQLADAMCLEGTVSEARLVEAVRIRSPRVVAIDDAHRLVRPLIGGLRDIDRLTDLARAVGGTTAWMLAVDTPAWQYLRRARGDRAIFDDVIRLTRWKEKDIRELVQNRSTQAGLTPRYDDLLVPREIDASGYGTERDDTERDFIRILCDYTDGNPAVALHFFRESLSVRDEEVYVRLFKRPPMTELENLPSSVYFVLRSIVQLDLASEADVVSCTHLHPSDVAGALRSARSRSYIEEVDNRVQVSIGWFRAVTSVLRRQHLLMETP